MSLKVYFYLAGASQLLPVAATLIVWGRRAPAQYYRLSAFGAFQTFGFLMDVAATARYHNNLWIWYLTSPVEVSLTLWVLGWWQPSERLRRGYHAAIPVLCAGMGAILLLTDPGVTFELWVLPGVSILMLAAALQTLTYRSLLSREPLTSQDWFWVVLGLAGVWVSSVGVTAFGAAFNVSHPDWVGWAYVGRAGVLMVSYTSMAWGVVCPKLHARLPGRS